MTNIDSKLTQLKFMCQPLRTKLVAVFIVLQPIIHPAYGVLRLSYNTVHIETPIGTVVGCCHFRNTVAANSINLVHRLTLTFQVCQRNVANQSS